MRRKWSSREAAFFGEGPRGKSVWLEPREGPWLECWSARRERAYFQHLLTGCTVWERSDALVVGREHLIEDSPVVAVERERMRNSSLDVLVTLTASMDHSI